MVQQYDRVNHSGIPLVLPPAPPSFPMYLGKEYQRDRLEALLFPPLRGMLRQQRLVLPEVEVVLAEMKVVKPGAQTRARSRQLDRSLRPPNSRVRRFTPHHLDSMHPPQHQPKLHLLPLF